MEGSRRLHAVSGHPRPESQRQRKHSLAGQVLPGPESHPRRSGNGDKHCGCGCLRQKVEGTWGGKSMSVPLLVIREGWSMAPETRACPIGS